MVWALAGHTGWRAATSVLRSGHRGAAQHKVVSQWKYVVLMMQVSRCAVASVTTLASMGEKGKSQCEKRRARRKTPRPPCVSPVGLVGSIVGGFGTGGVGGRTRSGVCTPCVHHLSAVLASITRKVGTRRCTDDDGRGSRRTGSGGKRLKPILPGAVFADRPPHSRHMRCGWLATAARRPLRRFA